MRSNGRTRVGRVSKAAGLVLAGAVAATALTGVSLADDATESEDQETAVPSEGQPWREQFGKGPGAGFPGMGPLLHGDQVVRTREGEYQEIAMQNGTITAVSTTSITVVSEDGYEQTYGINDATKIRIDRAEATASDLQVDRPVRVVADTSGTALHIGSRTEDGAAQMQQRREKFQQFRQDRAQLRQEFMQQWRDGSDGA
jgi:hypothetical protein